MSRHVSGERFAPDDLREVCRMAGEGLGREDAAAARFRSAAEMVGMWRGFDLPAWEAPYALRAARLGYLKGYEDALISGDLARERIRCAAQARWGEGWRQKLEEALKRVES